MLTKCLTLGIVRLPYRLEDKSRLNISDNRIVSFILGAIALGNPIRQGTSLPFMDQLGSTNITLVGGLDYCLSTPL